MMASCFYYHFINSFGQIPVAQVRREHHNSCTSDSYTDFVRVKN